MEYTFTKEIDAQDLKLLITAQDFPEIVRLKVGIGENNVVVGFAIELTEERHIQLSGIVHNYNPMDELLILSKYEVLTENRHREGFDLYRKLVTDMNMTGSLANIDLTISIYGYLEKMRCMLKDGMGETSLRYMVKHLQPLGLFTEEKFNLYKGWVREYCHVFKPISYTTAEAYDERLDAVETSESI